MSDTLKSCPFCGGRAEIHEGIIYGHYIECSSCELTLGVSHGCSGEWNGDFDGVGDAARAWNTRAAQKVKPLEWVVDKYGTHAKDTASAANAEYRMYQNAYGKWILGGVLVGMEKTTSHDSEEAAKSAAQSDYERRILSALDMEG